MLTDIKTWNNVFILKSGATGKKGTDEIRTRDLLFTRQAL